MAGAFRREAGGILGLAHLLTEHGEALEWDIAHYWPGRSILELYRGEMSWRELRVFLRYLPRDSVTARAICPPDPDADFWTPDRHLTATLIDAVREGTFATIVMGGDPKKTKRLKPPKPIPRPGVGDQQKPGSGVIRFGGKHGSGARELAAVFGGPSSN